MEIIAQNVFHHVKHAQLQVLVIHVLMNFIFQVPLAWLAHQIVNLAQAVQTV